MDGCNILSVLSFIQAHGSNMRNDVRVHKNISREEELDLVPDFPSELTMYVRFVELLG